jgi:hypothetical protein
MDVYILLPRGSLCFFVSHCNDCPFSPFLFFKKNSQDGFKMDEHFVKLKQEAQEGMKRQEAHKH